MSESHAQRNLAWPWVPAGDPTADIRLYIDGLEANIRKRLLWVNWSRREEGDFKIFRDDRLVRPTFAT